MPSKNVMTHRESHGMKVRALNKLGFVEDLRYW